MYWSREGRVQQMELKHIETKLARATTLPILPHVVVQLLALTDDMNASARDYERLITQDTALLAKILRTANSTYYGSSGQITTLRRALAQLGNNTLRSLCLTVSLQSALSSKTLSKNFDSGNFWMHSLAVACAAKVLACLAHDPHAEEAFVAGLVHDIGKLALCMFLPQEAECVYALMKTQNLSQYDAELKFIGVTHQDIGLMAAEGWQLPDIYLPPIARHHTPVDEENKEVNRMVAYVHVGNIIAHQIGLSSAPTGTTPDADPAVLEFLGNSEEQYKLIHKVIANEVQRLSSQMGFS